MIGEAVWQATIVDAVLVRYYREARDSVLARQPRPERLAIEGTLGGLRYVRNQIRGVGVPAAAPRWEGSDPVAAWTWQAVLAPSLGALPAAGREWELARYRAYQDFLAGHAVGETFGRAAGFLSLAAGRLPPAASRAAAAAP